MVCPAFLLSRGTVCSRSTRRQSRHKSRRCRRSHQLSRRRDPRCLFREGRNGQRVCVSLSRVCFASCWKVVALCRACGDKYGRITSLLLWPFSFFFSFSCKIWVAFSFACSLLVRGTLLKMTSCLARCVTRTERKCFPHVHHCVVRRGHELVISSSRDTVSTSDNKDTFCVLRCSEESFRYFFFFQS